MNHKLLFTLFAPLMLVLGACATVNDDAGATSRLLEPDAAPVALYAEGGLEVGEVTATDDGETLTVSYEVTEPGWCLMQTHLGISTHVEDVGGLEPTHFPAKGRGHEFAPGKGHDFAPGEGHDKHHGDDDDWDDWDDKDDRDDDDEEHDDDWDDKDDRDDDEDHGDDEDGKDDEDDDDDKDDRDGDEDHDGDKDDDEDEDDDKDDDEDYDDGKDDEDDGGKDTGDDVDHTDPHGFPYSAEHDCVGTYTYEIPLDDLGEVDDKLIIAAHATVAGRESSGGGDGGTGGECVAGMYGVVEGTGAIHRIDTITAPTADEIAHEEIASFDDSVDDPNYPNGLALDAANGRLYLADLVGGTTELSFYDLNAGAFTFAGTLSGTVGGAGFHEGAYYYVPEGTAELHRVTFAADGSVAGDEIVSGFAPSPAIEVVDLVFDGDTMYGSTTADGASADTTGRFFSFDLATGTYARITSGGGGSYLNLVFDAAGNLYGNFDATFYAIDPASGSSTDLDHWVQLPFADLASNFTCDGGTATDDGGTADPTTTVSAWAGEKAFPDATNGATYFVYALSWASL